MNDAPHRTAWATMPGVRFAVLFLTVTLLAVFSQVAATVTGLPYVSTVRATALANSMPLLAPVLGPVLAIGYEMFLFAIPVFAGWYLASLFAAGMLKVLYTLPDQLAAQQFLGRLINNSPTGAFAAVDPLTFDDDGQSDPLLRVGGPGYIFVPDGSAVTTERNGRFQRVFGAGTHRLGRFEYVHNVLDLRQQERARWEGAERAGDGVVRLITKDGIEIQANVTVTYRICTDDESCSADGPLASLGEASRPTLPSKQNPFPYGEEAVRRAAYATTVWHHDDRRGLEYWVALAPSVAVAALRVAAASYSLADLVYPPSPEDEPHVRVQKRMEDDARVALRRFGIHLINARIDRLHLPEEVTSQLIRTWQAPREKRRRIAAASVNARTSAEIEIANAEQKEAILRGLLEGIQRAQIDKDTGGVTREAVALRLSTALSSLQRRMQERTEERT